MTTLSETTKIQATKTIDKVLNCCEKKDAGAGAMSLTAGQRIIRESDVRHRYGCLKKSAEKQKATLKPDPVAVEKAIDAFFDPIM